MAEPKQSQEQTKLPPEALRRMAEMRVSKTQEQRRPVRGFKPVAYRTTPTELENLFQQSLPEPVAQIPVKEAMEALPPKEEPKPVEFVPAPTPQAIAEREAEGLAKRKAEREELAKKVKGVPGHMLATTFSILESVGEMVDTTPSQDQRKIKERLKRSHRAKARKKALKGKDFTLAKLLPSEVVDFKEEDILDPVKEKKLLKVYRAGLPDVSPLFHKGYKDAEKETAKRLKEMHWVERSLGDLGDVILAIPQLAATATGLAAGSGTPAQTGEAIASGVVGGTAHIFANPRESFESRPFMTLLTWIPALKALSAAGKVSGVAGAGARSVAGAVVGAGTAGLPGAIVGGITGAGAGAVGRKAAPALAKLKRQSAQVMIDGAKKAGINAPREVWAKFKRFWFDGMYQRTPQATRFVEDLIKAPQGAQQRVRNKIDELSRDISSGEQAAAEMRESSVAREMAVDPAGQISVKPKTEATQITVQERPGAVATEAKVDVYQEPVKTPVKAKTYEVYDPRTAELIDSIAAEVMDIRGLTPEHLQNSNLTSLGVKNAVRASLAAVLYDNSISYLARGSRARTKLIDNMFAKTELGSLSNKKPNWYTPSPRQSARQQIEQVLDNPKLTRAIVAGEDISSGIIPEITFRGKVVFNQLKLAEALRYELRPGGHFPMSSRDFRNKIKAEAMMRVGSQIANQTRKGTFKNLIDAELSKTRPEPDVLPRTLDVLKRKEEVAAAVVKDNTFLVELSERPAHRPTGRDPISGKNIDVLKRKATKAAAVVTEKTAKLAEAPTGRDPLSGKNIVTLRRQVTKAAAVVAKTAAKLAETKELFKNNPAGAPLIKVARDVLKKAEQQLNTTKTNLTVAKINIRKARQKALNEAKQKLDDIGAEITVAETNIKKTRQEALNQSKLELDDLKAQVLEAEGAGTIAQQRIRSSSDKFMEEALIGEGETAAHAPLMIEANPTELANHLKATKEAWLKRNEDAIVSEAQSRGLIKDTPAGRAEALADASRNFDDVVNRLNKYKQLPPEVVGAGKKVYADVGVHHTLVWEERARATLEGALLGKGALGFVDWAMNQMKANLTARNLPTHVNNFTANLALQMLRRGDPTIIARQMLTLKKWASLRDPAKRRAANLTHKEKRDMARLDALVDSGLFQTDMVQHEIGAALKGMPLQKAYMWGDQIFKLEEAMNVMNKLESAYRVMEVGDWIDLQITPRRVQRLWKLADGNMSLKEASKGGKALSIAELDGLSARTGGQSALNLFFDYSDVPTMVKFLKSSRVLSLASPFYTWFWKAMTTGGGKGLIGEVLSGPTTFKTNSKAINMAQFRELGGVSLRRTMMTQGFLGELRNNEDKKSRQKLYKYLPREVASHIVTELQDPIYSEGISVRGMNYADPQMIILRGIGSAIVKGFGIFGEYDEKELYPQLSDGSIDYKLKSVPPAQRQDILKRRRLWGMQHRNELMTYDQAIQFAGLTGGLAVDIISYIKEGSKDKRTHVDAATLWTQFGKIMVGGIGHAAISVLAAKFDEASPITTRRYTLRPQDPELTEDYLNWAMGQGLTSLLRKRKVKTAQQVHKIVKEGKTAMKMNLTKRTKDKIKNLRQLLRKAYAAGDDARAEQIEKDIELYATQMGRTNAIINHQAVQVKKRFIDSLQVFK